MTEDDLEVIAHEEGLDNAKEIEKASFSIQTDLFSLNPKTKSKTRDLKKKFLEKN